MRSEITCANRPVTGKLIREKLVRGSNFSGKIGTSITLKTLVLLWTNFTWNGPPGPIFLWKIGPKLNGANPSEQFISY